MPRLSKEALYQRGKIKERCNELIKEHDNTPIMKYIYNKLGREFGKSSSTIRKIINEY